MAKKFPLLILCVVMFSGKHGVLGLLAQVIIELIMDSKKVRKDRKHNPGKKSLKYSNLARSRWEKRSLSDGARPRGSGEFVTSFRETIYLSLFIR